MIVMQHTCNYSLSLETEFNTMHFINYKIPRLCSTFAAQSIDNSETPSLLSSITYFPMFIEYETISGNIINQIADHFTQFLLVKRININYKNTNFYQYNYSIFNKENFVEESPVLTGTD